MPGVNLYIARPLDVAQYPRVTQWFGETIINYSRYGLAGHDGIDYAAPAGALIMSAHDGKASVGYDADGYGNFVRVYGNGYQTLYAHMLTVLVTEGASVKMGQVIGHVGSTGNSTGSHLHFSLKINGMRNPAYRNWIDPAPFRVE